MAPIMSAQGLPKAKVNAGFVRKRRQKKQVGENPKGNFRTSAFVMVAQVIHK